MKNAALVMLTALTIVGCSGGGEKPISQQSCKELIRTSAQSVADHYGKGAGDKEELKRTIRRVVERASRLKCPGYEETVTTFK